ncbi:MAG TPA: ZIP family metal transporter [Candidatus Saccharibacteria bacterium]|nr:ZIP family metal transporter [Candidatus Saccharibacteria bacterium]
MDILQVIFWSFVGSVFSLAGGVLLVGSKKLRDTAIRFGLPFGAGALLAAAFLGLLPEAVEGSTIHTVALYSLGGFLGFFVLERLLGWFHHHESHHHDSADSKRNTTHQWLVIVGDTLHNAIDGVAIGAAFLINPAAGIGTALAVAAHEIPQEIGDFSILLGKGMRARNVILVNFFSALATVATALATYLLGNTVGLNPAPLIAIAAGFFIYIAASDIIPDIHEKPRHEGNIQALLLLVGVVAISTIISLTPHEHYHDASHDHEHNHHDKDHE